jgi:hypothetical protein
MRGTHQFETVSDWNPTRTSAAMLKNFSVTAYCVLDVER